MKKLDLPGICYEPSKIEDQGKQWVEVVFEGYQPCFAASITKDPDFLCWILTVETEDRTINCAVYEKLLRWTNMPIKFIEEAQKPIPMEIVGKPPVQVEFKKSSGKKQKEL